MVISEGYIAAMDDGMISWRPHSGSRRNHRLEFPATTILGVGGPSGKCESIWCGDTKGNLVRLSLPQLDVLDKYSLNASVIRSICAVSTSSDKILVGTSTGDVWTVGQDIPGKQLLLFSLDYPISSIRCDEKSIIIQSGWSRFTFDWTGTELEHHDQNLVFQNKKSKRTTRRARLLKFQQEKGTLPYSQMLDLPVVA
jgi:hypothetical protein